jgi:hypothetical protein
MINDLFRFHAAMFLPRPVSRRGLEIRLYFFDTIVERGTQCPDFITLDGGEGERAAPMPLIDLLVSHPRSLSRPCVF